METMKIDLKPCPFCGYVPSIVKEGEPPYVFYHLTNRHKRGCFIDSQNGYDTGKMSAFNWQCIAEVWNRRIDDDQR